MRRISDNTCTALQLANHWQDISRDWQQNRSYMPEETMAKFSVDWDSYGQRKATDEWRKMLAFEVDRAQELFDAVKEGMALPSDEEIAAYRAKKNK